MKLAIVGATGLVGQAILTVLAEQNFHFDELMLVASERSVGKKINFEGKDYEIISMEEAISRKPNIAIFSAGRGVSLQFAPLFEAAGSIVVDNSSAWRMSPRHKLIVPEINASILRIDDRIIANPNCSTIQMVLALNPLHKKYGIKRVVVSTYQSVTGTGKEAVNQLMDERAGRDGHKVYPHPIDLNVIPHIDVFLENGYTKEEMKMVHETKKIMGDDFIAVTSTAVRIPVIGGHAESVNVEFHNDYDLDEVRTLLSKTSGITVVDNPANNEYPMPNMAHGKDDVFVGRLRRDESQENTLNMWIVADNLRKGAATNAVQIAQYLVDHSLAF